MLGNIKKFLSSKQRFRWRHSFYSLFYLIIIYIVILIFIFSAESFKNKQSYNKLSLEHQKDNINSTISNSINASKTLLLLLSEEFRKNPNAKCLKNKMINQYNVHFEETHQIFINSIFILDDNNKIKVTSCESNTESVVDIKYITRWNMFEKMQKSKKIEIGRIEEDYLNNTHIIPMGLAVFGKDNTYIGSIFITFNLNKLFERIQKSLNKTDIAISFLNENNNTIWESKNFNFESLFNKIIFNSIGSKEMEVNGFLLTNYDPFLPMKALLIDKDIISLGVISSAIKHINWHEITYLIVLIGLVIILKIKLLSPVKNLSAAAKKILKGEKHVDIEELSKNADLKEISQIVNQYMSLNFQLIEANEKVEYLITSVESASDAKDVFIRNIRHVFRTPLHHIISSCDVMKSQCLGKINKGYFEYIEGIDQAGHQLLHAIDNVIAIADYDSDKNRLDESVVDLNDLLSVSTNAVKAKVKRKKLSLNLIIPDDIPKVIVDFEKMNLVIINLLNNAIAYNKQGGAINLEISRISSGIAIKISDSGVGIADATINYINDIFDKDESSLLISEKMGLGLNIVKNILNQHDIKFKIDSQEKFGTTIYLLIPNVRIKSV